MSSVATPRAPLLAIALAMVIALMAASPAVAAPVTEDTVASGVRAYWTPERMEEAEPVEIPTASGEPLAQSAATPRAGDIDSPSYLGSTDAGAGPVAQAANGAAAEGPEPRAKASANRDEIPDPSAEPFRTHGKIFFTVDGGTQPGDYLCSGTAVTSNNRSVVWTAGHCVFDDRGGGFVTNWVFVPGYEEGRAPFGEWPAIELATTEQWQQRAAFQYDFGAAIVAPNGAGQTLGELVGGRGIAFDQPRSQTYEALGYPAVQPPVEFDGEHLFRCTSPLVGSDSPRGSGPKPLLIDCDMNGGSSGGGWVAGDTVLSVSSYKYFLEDEDLYGPYQSGDAERLYERVAGAPARCGGKEVTILGTNGPDKLAGTSGRDVIKALGGDDVIRGKSGKDLICGGAGNDSLKGNKGRDKLKGEAGNDSLRGGLGRRDKCLGGAGRNTAASCEKRRRIS